MNAALLVAAGKGTRMGSGQDKLFLQISGRPLIAHTWQRFEDCPEINEIILVIRHDLKDAFPDIAKTCRFRKPFRLVAGGTERQDSVWNGLEALNAVTEIVAIHDGARPCVRPDLITQTIDAARVTGAAVAAQPVVDTIKESRDGLRIDRHIDRSRLWAVQTPQTFQTSVIRRAIAAARTAGKSFTDDTAACELIGQPVALVPCTSANPKLTAPDDLPIIESLLENR